MSQRVKLAAVAVTVAVLLLAVFASTTFAHGPGETDEEGQYEQCEMHGWGNHDEHEDFCSDTVSELLGLTQEEIHDQLYEGKSLAEIASAQGVSEDTLEDAIMAATAEAIRQRVAEGTLTQEKADLLLERMEQRTHEAVNRTTWGTFDGMEGGCSEFGEGMGHSGMMHWGDMDGHESHDGGMGYGMGFWGMQGWGRGMH